MVDQPVKSACFWAWMLRNNKSKVKLRLCKHKITVGISWNIVNNSMGDFARGYKIITLQ